MSLVLLIQRILLVYLGTETQFLHYLRLARSDYEVQCLIVAMGSTELPLHS